MVNFPLTEMTRVVTFNQKNLDRYFNGGRSGRLPTAEQCVALMEWLAPTQLEFSSFVDHLLDVLERQWKAELAKKKD